MIWELLVRMVILIPAWLLDRLDEFGSGLVVIGYTVRTSVAEVASWEAVGPILYVINPAYMAQLFALVMGWLLLAFIVKLVWIMVDVIKDARQAVAL